MEVVKASTILILYKLDYIGCLCVDEVPRREMGAATLPLGFERSLTSSFRLPHFPFPTWSRRCDARRAEASCGRTATGLLFTCSWGLPVSVVRGAWMAAAIAAGTVGSTTKVISDVL